MAFRPESATLDDGVRVFGLYLDSAKMESGVLQESNDKERFFMMPEINFLPLPVSYCMCSVFLQIPHFKF